MLCYDPPAELAFAETGELSTSGVSAVTDLS